MTAQESNKIKDRIIELLEENEGGQKPLYPLLHFVEAQLSAKEQEIASLERGIAGYSKEVSELQKIASDQDIELSSLRAEAKEREDYISELREAIYYPDKSLKPEVERLRAENERLNDDNKKLISGNAELRKRCEDLEGLLKEWLSQYGWPEKSLTIDTKKLLNQIKS